MLDRGRKKDAKSTARCAESRLYCNAALSRYFSSPHTAMACKAEMVELPVPVVNSREGRQQSVKSPLAPRAGSNHQALSIKLRENLAAEASTAALLFRLEEIAFPEQ